MFRLQGLQIPRGCRQFAILVSTFCLFAVCGCGAETYEKRLNETVKYYTYLEKVNNAVEPTPYEGDGISIRVPKGFEQINYTPPPRKKKKSDDEESADEEEEEPKDPRQPDYMEVELPGLEAAWTAQVGVPLGDKDVVRPVYLYAMSNAARWRRFRKEGAKDPKELHADLLMVLGQELDLIETLQEAQGAGASSGDQNTNRYFTIEVPEPNETRYASPKKFTAITLVPKDRTINDVETEFHVYLYSEGDAFSALLLVIPLNANPSERFVERMEIALHTLQSYKPNVTAPPSAPGAAGNAAPAGNQGGGGF